MPTPEDKVHDSIDLVFEKSGSQLQDAKLNNLNAAPDIALQNFPLAIGHGFAGYLLYIDGKADPVTETKKEGVIPTGLEVQAAIREQRQIVAEGERRLSVIDELQATVAANLIRADRLRQSILARAFSGELVTLQ